MAPTYRHWFYIDEEPFLYTYDTTTLMLEFDLDEEEIPIEVYINEIARILAQTPFSNWRVRFVDNSEEIREMVYALDDIPDSTSPTLYHRENGTLVCDDELDEPMEISYIEPVPTV